MAIPADVLEQLKQLGEDPSQYESMAKSEGEKFLRGFVAKVVESATLFSEWHPRLLQFAKQKRDENPLPTEPELDPLVQAQRRIVKKLVDEGEHVPTNSAHTSVLFSAPWNCLSVLHKAWPAAVRNAVFLTPEEGREWSTICQPPEGAFWWFAFQWWITEVPDNPRFYLDDGTSGNHSLHAILVRHGLQWGELAGGERVELWTSDGTNEAFVRILEDCTY